MINTLGTKFIRASDKKRALGHIREALPDLYPRLWRFCRILTGSQATADDLAQQACLQALDKAHQFHPGSHVDRWVFTIARHHWLNERRAQSVRTGHGTVTVEESGLQDRALDGDTNIFAQQVLGLVQALPSPQQMTVLLVYVEGYSYREAAEMLDVPIGTIMSRLAAARRTVAKQVQPTSATAKKRAGGEE